MAVYPKRTPQIGARGKYTVREPFLLLAGADYTCIAIRSFKDIYREGNNPYTLVYEPMGLINGITHVGNVFSYSDEEANGINIVTLIDDMGRSILIPDNYILTYPTHSNLQYLEYVFSASIGAISTDTDVTPAIDAIKDAIALQFGLDAVVKTHTVPTTSNPTYEEHLAFETARQARIVLGSSREAKITELSEMVTTRDATIAGLLQILRDHDLLPP